MTRHVAALALARYREGDLRQRKAARVSAHLTGCARCTDLSAELAGITTLLASTQAPPIPDHLAARINDTLAAEAALRVAHDPGTEPGRRDLLPRSARSARSARGNHRNHRNRRDRRPQLGLRLRGRGLSSPVVLRTLAAAGAVAVLAGGGYLVGQLGGGSSSSTSSAAAPRAASNLRPVPGVPNAAAGSAVRQPVFGPALHYIHLSKPDSVVPVSTGTNYRPTRLAAQVDAALSQFQARQLTSPKHVPENGTGAPAPAPAPEPTPAPAPAAVAQRFGGLSVAVLAGCVNRIAAGSSVLLVDVSRYQGRDATVIVTGPAGSAGTLAGSSTRQVWVVGPTCSASVSDVIAHRLIPGG